MRILLNGQQAFGKSVMEALVKHGEEIVAVYCPPDREGQAPDPVKSAAAEQGLAVFQPKSFRDPAVWEQMKSHQADLAIMAFVTAFVPEEALRIPKHGTILYHPSLLPAHRGPSAINWSIIMGDRKTGVSIIWPDNGLDTGPILLQKELAIAGDDTLGSVYFNNLFPMGVDAVIESVDLIKAGKAPRIKQDDALATYEGWCKKENVKVDWWKPVGMVYNLIRGSDPAPGAWTTHGDQQVQLFDARRAAETPRSEPGQVLEVSDKGIIVAAHGGSLLVQKVRADGGKKIAAADFAGEAGLKAGTTLGA